MTPITEKFSWLQSPPDKKIRVLHVVKHFYAGGAERLLSSILAHSNRDAFEHVVLSLSDENERISQIQHTLAIPYKAIAPGPDKNNAAVHIECLQFIEQIRPDIIKTWLPPGNITGGFIGKLLNIPVIWDIHDSQTAAFQHESVRHQALLAHLLPNAVVCGSRTAYEVCLAAGYAKPLLHVIDGGVDHYIFCHQAEGRKRIRQELGIAENALLIGIAAECTPIKRHDHFLKAAGQFKMLYPNTHFLLCGKFVTAENVMLKQCLHSLGLENHVHILGVRDDMADIYSALDIHTLNSRSETFGMATAEAIACETPAVATEVGMARPLLEDVGCLYEVSDDTKSLVHAWQCVAQWSPEEQQARTAQGRKRIIEHFSIVDTANAYDALCWQFQTRIPLTPRLVASGH